MADPNAIPTTPAAPPPGLINATPGQTTTTPGAPPDGAPPAGAPPMAPPVPPEASAPPMGKGEFDDESGKVKGGSLAKAEGLSLNKAELDGIRAELSDLRKALSEKDATIKTLEEGVGKVAAGFQRIITRQQFRSPQCEVNVPRVFRPVELERT